MVFNDEDLEMLKASHCQHVGLCLDYPCFYGVDDLIDRLEAAEKYGKKMAKQHPGWFLTELRAWRKTMGK